MPHQASAGIVPQHAGDALSAPALPSHAITMPVLRIAINNSPWKKGRGTISLQTKCSPTLLQNAFA